MADEDTPFPHPQSEPEDSLEQKEKKNQLSQAFSELDSSDQELIVALYDLKRCGDDSKQYAQRHGLHRSSVYRRHQRVLHHLRQRVFDLMNPNESTSNHLDDS